MHTLISLGQRIPSDIRVVGIDDVKYARLLPVLLQLSASLVEISGK